MTSDEIQKHIKALERFGLVVNKHSMVFDETPNLFFDRASYPGFEAHLFTIADATMWIPAFAPDSSIVLTGPKDTVNPKERMYCRFALPFMPIM